MVSHSSVCRVVNSGQVVHGARKFGWVGPQIVRLERVQSGISRLFQMVAHAAGYKHGTGVSKRMEAGFGRGEHRTSQSNVDRVDNFTGKSVV